jgi:hypothetical protein
MQPISVTKRVEAPVSQVFTTFTDLASAPERVQGIVEMELLTDGPVGIGTRFRETRVMFGKRATEEMEIVAFERDKSMLVQASSHGSEYLSKFTFDAKGDATDVTMTFNAKPITVMAKLMSPLGKLMAGTMKKCVEKDLEDLKRCVESGGGEQAATAAG